ncbi:TonB family protein [Gilvimarinus sp. DA14]|uniref:TonB family protein n=1 Tax=Gilvimarinus sp. DA14 TaxID=2956798 RepID=UPI0020B7D621|nr:TonB family protein [Gilvimarinus sp. DA14]UTF59625.1 TonB family protein [Gilvimarinus sp. DA14]
MTAAPLLNGMAVHQELGKDQFIGAIYSESLTENADVLLAADMPMRMELKVTANRGLSARRFSRMWIEGMAINNRSDALTAQADNMVAFTKMFTERLREGDHIVFALTPGEGVSIIVDTITIGTIANDDFFALLASTWVGRVPLSSNFRDQLLVAGDVSDSLRSRYQSLSPTPERIDQVAGWIAPEPAPAPTPEPEPEVAAQPQSEAAPAIAEAAPVIAAPKIELPKTELPAAEPAAQAAAEPEPEPEPTPEPVRASSAVAVSSSSVAAPEPEPEEEDSEDYVPTFTAESLLANQRYFSRLVRQVQLEIEYPRRALQRGYEGFVRIAVALDRSGNLLNAEMLEETEYSILNSEAMEAVEDAAPYPEIPEIITGITHEFTIPITFALRRE